MEAVRAQVAVLSVTGGAATGVAMENVVADALTRAGHAVSSFESVKNSETAIRAQLVGWIEDPDIDLVIVVGDGHNISRALAPLTDEALPGFADLLRMLAFQEIGASAMLSTAEAARCGTTFVFVLPLGEAAVRAAMEKLILPQLDPNTQPKNLISEMPRFHEEGDFTRVDHEHPEDQGVPLAIVKEKTATGAGMIPRLPARAAEPIPDPARKRPSTQGRVKQTTNKNVLVNKVEDPTKPIELQKLEKQIELSKITSDSTKPMDLSKLPKLPPGARRDQLPPEVEELTVRAPKVSDPLITTAPPPVERPQAGPVGRPKGKPVVAAIPKMDRPAKPSATPALPLPVVAKKPALIVDEPEPERPALKIPPKIAEQIEALEAIEPIEPIEAEELVEEVKPAIAVVDLAALDAAAAAASLPPVALTTAELEAVSEVEEREAFPPPVVTPPKPRPPTQPPPRRSPTQPPPEPVAKPVAPPLVDKHPARDLAAVPLPATTELPAGNFDYKVKKSKLPLYLAVLLLGGIAAAAVIMLTRKPAATVVPDAVIAVGDPPPADAAQVLANPDAPEEIEMEAITADAGRRPSTPRPPVTPRTSPSPDAGPVTRPEVTDAAPVDKPDAKVEPVGGGDGECDEPACVIDKYARPCCLKFKPTGEGFTPGTSDSLEKAQIRAGIERMRPAISRCGETNPGKGTVKISVAVSPDGVVTSAEVVEAPSPGLGTCVANFVKKATFAKTVNGGSFSYPFVF